MVGLGLAALIAVGLVVAREPAPARAGYLAAPPYISVEPNCAFQHIEGPPSPLTHTYHLRNFTPGAQVIITYGVGDPPQQQTVTVGTYGSLDIPLTFQHGSSGDVTVNAVDAANTAMAASAVIRVPCKPTVRLTQNCDPPADPAVPRTLSIIVDGTGWDLNGGEVTATLMQRLPDFQDAVRDSAAAVPGADGIFSVTLDRADPGSDDVSSAPLMALAPGDYFVRVEQPRFQIRVEADFAVPCAQVAINPTCGDAGGPPDLYDIVVSGSGFRPFVRAEVIFDAIGQPQVFLLDVGPSGQLLINDVEEARILPFRRPEQPTAPYAVTVRQWGVDQVSREVSVGFVVPCPPPPPPPTITIDPLCGPPQIAGDELGATRLRITGVSLPPGETVIRIDPDGLGGALHQFAIPHAGSFDVGFDLPWLTKGDHVIEARQEIALVGAAAQPFISTYLFRVPCEDPRPRLGVRCDPPGGPFPDLADVVITARRFYGDAPLEFTVAGVTEVVRTDAQGRFVRRTPAAGFAAGPLQVAARQVDTSGAVVAEQTTTFTLPCGERDPILTISPDSGVPGMVVTVSGANLLPNTALRLRWSKGIGSSRPIDVTTDEDGIFERQVLIFHHDFSGARELIVEASSDPAAAGTTVGFIVVPGSGTPPGFVDAAPGFPPLIMRR